MEEISFAAFSLADDGLFVGRNPLAATQTAQKGLGGEKRETLET